MEAKELTRSRYAIGSVVAVAAILCALFYLTYRAGASDGHGTASFEGAITLANYDGTDGCIQTNHGQKICGAFVNEVGGGNSQFTAGQQVTGRIGTLSIPGRARQVIFLNAVLN